MENEVGNTFSRDSRRLSHSGQTPGNLISISIISGSVMGAPRSPSRRSSSVSRQRRLVSKVMRSSGSSIPAKASRS